MKKIFFISSVVVIILLSLFPRMVEVLNGNPIFGFDHGRDYLAVRSIVVDHKFTLIGAELGAGSAGLSYVFQGPGYYYFLAIPFIFFHGNPVGGVWEMLFLGLSTVAFGFYFGKKIWGAYGGLLVAFLIAVSPMLIPQSRSFWNPHVPTVFILITFFFVYQFILNRKRRDLFLAAFFSGFIYNFEFAISIPLCITLVIFSIGIIREKLREYVYLLLGFLIAFSPMLAFELRHHFMAIRSLVIYLFIHKNTDITPMFIYMHGRDTWGTILYSLAHTFPADGVLPPIILLLGIGFLLCFSLMKEKDLRIKSFFYYLILLLPVNIYVFDSLQNTTYPYYLTDLTLGYILMVSYLAITFLKKKKYLFPLPIIGIIGYLFVVAAISSFQTSISDYKDYGGTAKLKGKVDAIDYIYKDAKGKPFGLFVFSPPIYTYPYDYILQWHGEPLYHYLPSQSKEGTFYLLIEPDHYKPWSYNGWLETVIKTGTIEYTKTLPSGFIIQKRIGTTHEN